MWLFPLPYGAYIVIEVEAESALAALRLRESRLSDMGPLLTQIAILMRHALGERFAEGGNPPWQPLAPSTVASKLLAEQPAYTAKGRAPWRLKQRGNFGPENILIRTGALRDSYRRKDAPGHIEKIDVRGASVEVGSRHRLAKIHQEGTGSYIIRAKIAKALAFTGSSGETLFRKVVQHPGLPPRPVTLTEPEIQQIREMIRLWVEGGTLYGRQVA